MSIGSKKLPFPCRLQAHCQTCRDTSESGHKWRESLAKVFKTPGGKIDFDCPHGIPWDATGEQLPEVARQPKPQPNPTYEANRATCEACDEKPTCRAWKPVLSPCGREKMLRGDPKYPCCPEGKLQTLAPEQPSG